MGTTKALGPGLLLIVPMLASPASAQKTTFNPSINIGGNYSSNVENVSDSDSDRSDTATSLSIDLPVVRDWATGSLSFGYRPSYYKQKDEKDLDRDEHVVNLDWANRVGPKTSLGFSTHFARTQGQASAELSDRGEVEDTDLLLTRRTDRDSWGASFRLARTESPRWDWSTSLSWSMLDHEEIPGFDPETGTSFDVEDRTDYGASLEASRAIQRNASVGLRYEVRRFDLDLSPDETSNSLSFTMRHNVSRKLGLSLAIGASRTTGDEAGGSPDDDERTEFDGRLTLTRSFEKVILGLQASHRPTSGGHLTGTSTNSSLGLSLTGAQSRNWQWGLFSRWVQRDPVDDEVETTDTLAVGARVERGFLRTLGIALGANYADQSSDAVSASDFSVLTANVGLVWYPLGRSVVGRRGGTP